MLLGVANELDAVPMLMVCNVEVFAGTWLCILSCENMSSVVVSSLM